MKSTRHLLAAVLIAIGLTGGALFFARAYSPADAAIRQATVFPEARTLADFELVDESGNPFTEADLRGQWNLLFFGFTHCPDICPATLQQLSVARQKLAESGAQELPGIVFVSVDPQRDTPAALAEYVAHFGDGVRGVTGSDGALRTLTKPLGIFYAAEPTNNTDNNYSVNHSSAVLFVNPQAQLRALFSTPHRIDNFVNDLPLIMAMQ